MDTSRRIALNVLEQEETAMGVAKSRLKGGLGVDLLGQAGGGPAAGQLKCNLPAPEWRPLCQKGGC